MKTCFCGCGTRIPRVPIGIRSMNTRGRLMLERLAWCGDLFSEEAYEEHSGWLEDGMAMVTDLQGVMHGEVHPRSLTNEPSATWLEYGRDLDVAAQENGAPSLAPWLEAHPKAVEKMLADWDEAETEEETRQVIDYIKHEWDGTLPED